MLEFEIGSVRVDGVDLTRTNEMGKIIEFEVIFPTPLATQAVHQLMAAFLVSAKAGSLARASEAE